MARGRGGRRPPPRKETPLMMVLGILRFGTIIIARKVFAVLRAFGAFLSRHTTRLSKNAIMPFAIAGLALLLVLFIALGVRGATKKNAHEVYVNGNLIDTVMFYKGDEKGEAYGDYVYKLVIARLTAKAGANVRVHETITAKDVHAKAKGAKTESATVSDLENLLTFDVLAAHIYVNGALIATVNSKETADAILDGIQKSAVSSELNIVRVEFIENVEVKEDFVDIKDIETAAFAKAELTKDTQAGETYRVISGDTLSRIAANADMTLEELLSVNPGITVNTVLHIGDVINIMLAKPLLSVRTFERRTYTEVIDKPVSYIYNENQKKSYKVVITQGRDGERTVTSDFIRENRFEVGKNIIEEKITIDPIEEVVEVGTK